MALVRRWAVEQGVGVVAVLHDLNLALRYAHDSLLLAPGLSGVQTVGATADLLTSDTIAQVWGVRSVRVSAADGVPQCLVAENLVE